MADEREIVEVIRMQGAEFCGIHESPRGALILFADPESRTTLEVPESEFSAQAIAQQLEKSRRAFHFDCWIQKSLC
jgi:hypothetical protein